VVGTSGVRAGAQKRQYLRSLLMHIVELSTAVVKVDIKVINASLTQNQCLIQCVTPPLTHAEIPRLRDATELNNDGMIMFVDVHYQTKPNLSFFRKSFNQRLLQFLFAYIYRYYSVVQSVIGCHSWRKCRIAYLSTKV